MFSGVELRANRVNVDMVFSSYGTVLAQLVTNSATRERGGNATLRTAASNRRWVHAHGVEQRGEHLLEFSDFCRVRVRRTAKGQLALFVLDVPVFRGTAALCRKTGAVWDSLFEKFTSWPTCVHAPAFCCWARAISAASAIAVFLEVSAMTRCSSLGSIRISD